MVTIDADTYAVLSNDFILSDDAFYGGGDAEDPLAFGPSAISHARSGKWCYWRKPERLPNGQENPEAGYIVAGPAWAVESERARDKGMVPLKQYGTFLREDPRAGFSVLRNPYLFILKRGGAKEFPVRQILEFGWDLNPPLPGVRFPQLEGVQVERFRCPACFNRSFLSREDLERHETIIHAEAKQSNQLARNLAAFQSGSQEALTSVLNAIVERTDQLSAALARQAEITNTLLAVVADKLSPEIKDMVAEANPVEAEAQPKRKK